MKRSIRQQTLKEKLGLAPKDLRDPFLREAQKRWDSIYFDQTYTRESNGTCFRDAKVDHIGDHIAKLLKKMQRIRKNEDDESGLEILAKEAVGDAAMYRTQLANTLSFNLQRRLGDMRARSSSLDEASDLIIEALPQDYTEPHEHSRFSNPQARSEVRNRCIPALHMATLVLAEYCEVDPHRAHLGRLADKPNINGIE